jgi:hypothetical protein
MLSGEILPCTWGVKLAPCGRGQISVAMRLHIPPMPRKVPLTEPPEPA